MEPPPGCDPDSVVLTFPVVREMAGMRLDRFIQVRIPRLSRSRAQRIVKSCAFRADGAKRRPSDIVREGEVVLLVRERFKEPDTPLTFGVLHEDDWVLVIDKPAGLPMHPTATYHRHTLSYLLREQHGEEGFAPRIAHRLDRETSGVVLCGKTREAERALKMEFEAHRVEKTYLAIVRGLMPDDTGRIELPMAPVTEGLHVMMEVREGGHRAVTDYKVRERRADHTLVELFPESGRQHQLRVHLAALGYPILGDKLYGPEREAPFLEIIESGLTDALLERLGHHRQALHAHAVTIAHPGSAEPMTVTSPFAPDLEALWRELC